MRLIVTEKPSVAQAIAAALDIQDKKAGYLEGSGYLVSWCVGHLVELAPPEQYDPRYARWRLEDLPIVPQAWAYGVIQKTARSSRRSSASCCARTWIPSSAPPTPDAKAS